MANIFDEAIGFFYTICEGFGFLILAITVPLWAPFYVLWKVLRRG